MVNRSFVAIALPLLQLLSCEARTLDTDPASIQGDVGQHSAHDHLNSLAHQDAQVLLSAPEAQPSSATATSAWFASNHAGHARWLVHATDYAVFGTHSTMREDWPFTNVVSISDGAQGNSTGRIIVYVATISQFAKDVEADSKVSVGVSQAQANGGQGCEYIDVEWPLCARVSIFGHARVVPPEAEAEAADIMFARHTQMKAWAALAHKWAFYEVHITDIRILDFFGGFHEVTPEEYFAAPPQEPLVQRQ